MNRLTKLDNQMARLEASVKKLKRLTRFRVAGEYMEAKLTSLRKRLESEHLELGGAEMKGRASLESLRDEFKNCKLEQPRLVDLCTQLEKEIKSVGELSDRFDEHFKTLNGSLELLRIKFASKSYLERLGSAKTPESMDGVEMNTLESSARDGREDDDNEDDEDDFSPNDLSLLEMFETFHTKKKSTPQYKSILFYISLLEELIL